MTENSTPWISPPPPLIRSLSVNGQLNRSTPTSVHARLGERSGLHVEVARDDVVSDERLHVLVEQCTRDRRALAVVPLERQVVLVGAIRIDQGVTGRAAQGSDVEVYPRGDVRVVRAGHRPRGAEAQHEIVGQVERKIHARQHVVVVVIDADRVVVAEHVLDGARRVRIVGVRGLLGLHPADSDVAAPAVALEVAHQVAAIGLFADREALLRIEITLGRGELVEQKVPGHALVDLPVALQRPGGRTEPVEEITGCQRTSEHGAGRVIDRRVEGAVTRRVENEVPVVIGEFGAETHRVNRPNSQLTLEIRVAVGFLVVVQDLVQRAEDQSEVFRRGRIDVLEAHLRRVAAQVVAEGPRRTELDERLRARIALSLRVADAEAGRPVLREIPGRQQVDVGGVGLRESLDRVIDDAEVLGATVQRRDRAGDRRVVLNRRVGQRAAVADRARRPRR